MKARFTEQQPPVKIIQKDGNAYVYICKNETQGTETYPDMGEGQTQEIYYEYDYNEIIGPADALPLEDIQAHPENYLDYEFAEKKLTIEERLAALEQNQAQMDTIFEEVVNSESGIL